jgi:hypothetical protein
MNDTNGSKGSSEPDFTGVAFGRLSYYTSMTQTQSPSALPPCIPKSIQYYTSLQSTDIALNNLKKLNNRLDENNIITLAYLVNNPNINNEDREKYSKQLKEKSINEYHLISSYVNDIICRNKDSSSNITECVN